VHWLDRTSTLKLDLHEPDLEDSTYLIPCFEDLRPLVESVSRIGVVNSPVVQRTVHGNLIPMLGRRRIRAARQAGLQTVDAEILPAEMPETEGFKLAFWDNLGSRPFDSACSAYLVRRLLDLFPRDVVARDFLPALGIPSKGPRLERLSAVGGLEFTVLEALASGRIHEKTAAILAEMKPGDRLTVLELADQLRLNTNKAAEIIGSLFDLSIFRGTTITELIRDRRCQAILHDAESSVPDKASRFRSLVRSWKFPELVAKEDQFELWRSGLRHDNRIQVRAVSAGESEECLIEIRVRDRPEAETILQKIKGTDVR